MDFRGCNVDRSGVDLESSLADFGCLRSRENLQKHRASLFVFSLPLSFSFFENHAGKKELLAPIIRATIGHIGRRKKQPARRACVRACACVCCVAKPREADAHSTASRPDTMGPECETKIMVVACKPMNRFNTVPPFFPLLLREENVDRVFFVMPLLPPFISPRIRARFLSLSASSRRISVHLSLSAHLSPLFYHALPLCIFPASYCAPFFLGNLFPSREIHSVTLHPIRRLSARTAA
mgnify:CR=1 FL=1